MMKKDSQWYLRMKAKYGSDEKITEIMRNARFKGTGNLGKKGGFASLTEEQRKEIAQKGVAARKAIENGKG